MAGIILATGRIVGETAALIYTAGTVAAIPSTIMGSARTLSVHLYILSSEGQHLNETNNFYTLFTHSNQKLSPLQ